MDEIEIRRKGLENLILLILGSGSEKISLLHLQKESFILWNFHPSVRSFLQFIKHYRGPFSSQIESIIHNPFYLDGCWKYISPHKRDTISGGYVILTENGINEYNRLYDEAKKDVSLRSLLTGIKMVHDLYDKLSLQELLLLIYDAYPEYTEKSNISQKINTQKKTLASSLLKKGIIDDEKYDSLIGDTAYE
jgi:hypothetical protein